MVKELELIKFRNKLSDFTLRNSNTNFRYAIDRPIVIKFLTVQQMADGLRQSRPTIGLWRKGKNLPHHVMRRRIFEWLDKTVSIEIARLRK
ncbi:MAG: hypothetical protein UX81_C0001G0020 [Parcubacteria group bacterium GW2011_GWA2_47_12]|uniref:Uncharacterized protein n=1 Tax=Candidatus Giovannonibacteria bacterium RIFCSPLOWO2_01_FULL_44_16 TaxID=1798348 RepID=A0A1F5X341_9BACT|nr:MAG: hypothetical protein UX81_C0001G0020 [Parcubacteria group bacterium GW2011_GWA2_47_12]OGF81991.1 MAG: hypothetical protein A2924_04265 [Candidatus Giovannonibacteria bacterium RIFCSPLOWO2_01_FULL_44_16]